MFALKSNALTVTTVDGMVRALGLYTREDWEHALRQGVAQTLPGRSLKTTN